MAKQVRFELDTLDVSQILDGYDKKRLNLEPGFQRRSVWSKKDRQSLIETMLRGYPMPAVFFYRSDREGRVVYDVLDGKQRIETILRFTGRIRNGRFSVKMALAQDGPEESWDWRRLEKARKQILIEGYKIPVVKVEGGLGDIIDVFVRINSTGKALSAQERRHARYHQSPLMRRIARLADQLAPNLCEFGIVSAQQQTRMKHIELIAELVVSVLHGDVIHKKKALDSVLGDRGLNLVRIDDAVKRTKAAIRRLLEMFPELNQTRFVQVADFYSLVVLIDKFQQRGMILDDRVRSRNAWGVLRRFGQEVDELRQSVKRSTSQESDDGLAQRYLATVTDATDAEVQRRNRESILRHLLESIFERKDERRIFTVEQRRLLWHSTDEKYCSGCGIPLTWGNFQLDHIRAHSRGGRSELGNAQLMCPTCNQRKGAAGKVRPVTGGLLRTRRARASAKRRLTSNRN